MTVAVCVAYDEGGQLAIAAFVTGERLGSPLDTRRAAAELLPDSMLPDRIEPVPSLPSPGRARVDERRLLAEAGLTPPAAGADGRDRAVGPPGQARPMTQRGRDQSCQYSTTS